MNDPEEREKIAPQPEWENNQNLEYAEYYLARNLVLMPVSELAKGVSDLLEEILRESENAEIDVTLFHVPVPPVITIAAFLERIAKYSRCCQETYILAFIYIDRYNKEKQSSLNHHNVHKMFITALMIAAKFHDDFRLSNKDFAKIGGISSKEIRALEEEFLTVIRFSVYVECEDFENYADGILRPTN